MCKIIALFVTMFLFTMHVFSDYPLIRYTVKSRDPLYSQQQQDVESWYTGNDNDLPLAIFRYKPRPSEDLFAVAAAFNITYETLATLNGWDTSGLFSVSREMLVPNMPGIFVAVPASTRWEKALYSERLSQTARGIVLKDSNGENQHIQFYPGSRFTAQERIRFLGSIFASPLAKIRITSNFGYRLHPVSGEPSFHPGIDLKAKMRTPVLAAKDGQISDKGTLEIYGHYVIISHDGDYKTVYAHLDEILVTLGQNVRAGERIALSGNSGISTGPHLHFEIRRNGIHLDPLRLTALRH